MTKSRCFFIIPILLFLFSCSSTKQVTEIKDPSQSYFDEGKYAEALSGYEKIIAKYEDEKKTAECPVYSQAGISAMKVDQIDKAQEYLKLATYTPFADANTYAAMAAIYRNIDNLSLEIEALEDYVDKYPGGAEIGQMKMRLFQTYVESENWQQAFDLWTEIEPQAKMEINYLEDYYLVNKALENETLMEQLAGQLLDMNDENVIGLEYMAKKYYSIAENHYQAEMDTYESNKTRKQYAKLLEALEEVTKEFQVALGYFESLYRINPLSAYANYMGNIYVRFNDQEKADYYHNLGLQK